ncbi:MAG: aminotransferase class III-fold pyridoxal phosphate-dependent enzyme [Spirochaetaceae bacterium]|nr:MAG: aminotransferase class III-fold pyridoxal phosphate-dependent enzyme [Spirochaetaceae bacterium]
MMEKAAQFHASDDLLKRALRVTPLGAQTFSKSYRYFPRGNAPLFLEKGDGCRVWDVDGNCFVDYICALGPVTVGYHDERVDAAVIEQLEKGISFSQPTPIEVTLAEKLTRVLPGAEMVRFVKNGSDATTAAVRLARAHTERDVVFCCGYHGMHDWYICSTTNDAGVPAALSEMTVTFPYNDIAALKSLFLQYKDRVACVIMEPIQGDGPQDGYHAELADVDNEDGALLIFDEVVSGFRYALGGASELFDVTPDLAAYGKGMANGLPLSVVVGRRDVMELIAEKAVFISTTFGGEALSIAAALATIEILEKPGVYKTLRDLGDKMLLGLEESISRLNIGGTVATTGLSPHAGVKFEASGGLDYLDLTSVFEQEMIRDGILTYGITNLNTSHGEREIERYVAAAERAFSAIKKAVDSNTISGILTGAKIEPVFRRN